MPAASFRYIVDDIDAAIAFYRDRLGFTEVMRPAPTFAMLSRGGLRLVLSAPGGGPGGGQAIPDGTLPAPGGWNRLQLEVDDVESMVNELRREGVAFRSDVVNGVGGKQIIAEDPSGNPVELFEPLRPEARLSRPAEARRIAWVGIRTDAATEMVRLLEEVLHLERDHQEEDFWVLRFPEGGKAEVFGPGSTYNRHFGSAPVVGFLVEDVRASAESLGKAGVEVVHGPDFDEVGNGWVHFRGPDGNLYELTSGTDLGG